MEKPKLTYAECDVLVLAYRDNNDEEAALKLIQAFEGYIVKYFNTIRRGRIVIGDRDIRDFLKLYMKNDYTRRHIHQFRRMTVVQQEIYAVAQTVRKLCEPYSDDELMNEIYVAFLTMAKRYKSPDGLPRFHTYILRAFHFQLRRQLQTLTSDPLVFRMGHNLSYFEDSFDGDASYDIYDVDTYVDHTPTFTIEEEMDTINENWVLGYTTEDEFKDLTVMERKIVKMYYGDEMSDQQIADQLGTCRATINRRRNKVKRSLQSLHGNKFRIE